MGYVERAEEYFCNNFNCSQAVFTTYAAELGMDEIRCATAIVEQIIKEND